jgi:uncharacterized protein (TIGR02246 family)
MKRMTAFSVAVLMTAVACAVPPAADPAQALADLREADTAYLAAVNAKDTEAFLAFYAADAVMFAPNAPAATGLDAIRAMATEMFGMEGMTVNVTSVRVDAWAEMGYSRATAAVTVPGPDGMPMAESGPDVHVWKKQADGSWKIVIDIWNSDVPLPMPMNAASGS